MSYSAFWDLLLIITHYFLLLHAKLAFQESSCFLLWHVCAHGGLHFNNEKILFNRGGGVGGCALEGLNFNVDVHFPPSWKTGKQRPSARLILAARTREFSDIQRLCALHYRWSAQSFIKGACVAVRGVALLREKYLR